MNACVQAVEFAKLCFSNRYQKGNTSLKNNIFLWFISFSDMNQELGCGHGVIDVLTQNLSGGLSKNFDVLLTVRLSIILIINQLNAQNLVL